MNYGEAISMAYDAGAEFKNAEFGNQYTPVEKDTETWCWGNHLLENAQGERILEKHFPGSTREIGFQTIMAMYSVAAILAQAMTGRLLDRGWRKSCLLSAAALLTR
jgi:MFS family permease